MRILAGLLVALSLPAVAQQAVTLPGGASATTETHGDWTVRCQVRQPEGQIACLVQQEQVDNQSRQRLIAMEVVPNGDGLLGTLILPFGLVLDSGVTFQIDDKPAMQPTRFRTCVPAGCLIPVTFDAPTLVALRAGTVLKINAVADDGAAVPFSISLQGFGAALDRAGVLSR